MAFWREHMPAGMFLRSGPDWHLDPAHELTFQRYLDEQQLSEDPIPLALFLAYTRVVHPSRPGLTVEDEHVIALRHGRRTSWPSWRRADRRPAQVVAAPGHRALHPHAGVGAPRASTPATSSTSTASSGARVLIVGGRQSAYEWAALLSEHGAEHIDVVHRHATAALRQGQLGASSTR